MNTKNIYLLRHGLTKDSDKHPHKAVFRGRTDTPLSPLGWLQMQDSAEQLKIQQIFSSPLQRCAAFAQQLSDQQQIPLAIETDLQELDFGQWDGCTIDEIAEYDKQALQQFWSDPLHHPPPGGEPLQDFKQRVSHCWQSIIQSEPDKDSLLVIHGGVQKIILAHILQMPLTAIHNIEVPYACCSTIQVYYNDNKPKAILKCHGKPP